MAGAPDRSFSFNRNDEQALQPGYQSYQSSQPYHYDQRDVSPIEGQNPQFPSPSDSISPPPPPAHRNTLVGTHPDSGYSQMQSQRQYGMNADGSTSQNYSNYSPPGITPGADNLSEGAAGGGINGIALGVANMNERESGAQALRDINNWGRSADGNIAGPRGTPLERNQTGTLDYYGYDQPMPPRPIQSQPSYGSNTPLAAGAVAPAGAMPGSAHNSERSLPLDGRPSPPQNAYPYQDSPYNRYSSSNLNLAPQMGDINPNDVADDDDWGMTPQHQKRRSFIPFGGSRDGSRDGTPGGAAAAAAATAAATTAAGGTGAVAATRDASGKYNAVPGGSGSDNSAELVTEKSEWLNRQNSGNKRLKWIVGTILAIIVVGAIVGGVLGGVLSRKKGPSSAGGGGDDSSPESVANDNKDDLSKDSDEIKKLMTNPDLHKVFPGMDYTALNAQYPECMHAPPSQNNVTRDIAVLSLLTNNIRLYGTDCNQTEMVLHAIDRLELTDMKVWLGVWLGNNDTTNERQVSHMWKLLDETDSKKFRGIIVGNEVLFRQDLTETELLKVITDIKSNLTDKKIDLPIATSDLGDNWTADMATKVDIVMSNVHPFFAGVTAENAAGWTWDFWTTHDVVLTKSDPNIKQIVAEVGWPSKGGNNCGQSTCPSGTHGSVAGIDEMNTFMDTYICQSLENGTEFFWFEAFDEPWKVRFNEKGKEWEDQWGLMDVNRKLKDGVKIPDCGGKTAS
ncbi:glycoside hydrolase family 17 protein [Zopfia rhizophila CBS 207.26]|uniref:glucan endo-1,3-beta-D-glucosidase n=1 Tax=Zopfia rhizophila CBS 207.26 TaxID=1314779 RepID=A0A6A6D9M5_9PEZI|nr:glycoside hydrolase family 17 protein [Zopfia rhizophila CBS 207.26]